MPTTSGTGSYLHTICTHLIYQFFLDNAIPFFENVFYFSKITKKTPVNRCLYYQLLMFLYTRSILLMSIQIFNKSFTVFFFILPVHPTYHLHHHDNFHRYRNDSHHNHQNMHHHFLHHKMRTKKMMMSLNFAPLSFYASLPLS